MRIIEIDEEWVGDVATRTTTITETPDPAPTKTITLDLHVERAKDFKDGTAGVGGAGGGYAYHRAPSGRYYADIPLWRSLVVFFTLNHPHLNAAEQATRFMDVWTKHPSE